MWWLIVFVAMFLGAGSGIGCFAWAEDGLEPPVNVVSGLSEPSNALAGSEDDPAAEPFGDVVSDRERVEEAARAPQAEFGEATEYDPWEPFNERMFTVNRDLDHYVLKPVATGWNTVIPSEIQGGLGRMFDNVFGPRRFVNCFLQGKAVGAGRELARFVLNSTFGVAGIFDAGKDFGLQPCDEDTGQTLAVWGVGAGPYLTLPLFPPMTVRDGIGLGVDGLLNPINWVTPFVSVGVRVTDAVNSRSQNLEVFEDVEEGTLDMYSAVRNGYLQRRARAIQE